ncbi:hypothetical protein ACLOJK_028059 [Asimina triloba]
MDKGSKILEVGTGEERKVGVGIPFSFLHSRASRENDMADYTALTGREEEEAAAEIEQQQKKKTKAPRLASLDVFRGLSIFVYALSFSLSLSPISSLLVFSSHETPRRGDWCAISFSFVFNESPSKHTLLIDTPGVGSWLLLALDFATPRCLSSMQTVYLVGPTLGGWRQRRACRSCCSEEIASDFRMVVCEDLTFSGVRQINGFDLEPWLQPLHVLMVTDDLSRWPSMILETRMTTWFALFKCGMLQLHHDLEIYNIPVPFM